METKRVPAGGSSFFPSESLERKTQHSSVQSIGSISSKISPLDVKKEKARERGSSF